MLSSIPELFMPFLQALWRRGRALNISEGSGSSLAPRTGKSDATHGGWREFPSVRLDTALGDFLPGSVGCSTVPSGISPAAGTVDAVCALDCFCS